MRLQFPGVWQNAAWLSCVIHFAVIFAVGTIASGMAVAEVPPPEKLIAVDLSPVAINSSPASAGAMERGDEGDLEDSAAMQDELPEQITDSSLPAPSAEFAPSGAVSSAVYAPGRHEAGGRGAASGRSQSNGQTEGAGAASSAKAPAGVSAADRHAAVDRFVLAVERHKKYPYMAMKRGLTGIASVHVRLGEDGDLRAAEISASSGVKSLDDAALDAVRNACPFRHGLGEPLHMIVPVNYQLAG